MNKQIIEVAIVLTQKQNHNPPYELLDKLFTTGKVVTTDTPENILGFGGVANFVSSKEYSGGVDLHQWTLNPEFWKAAFFADVISNRADELEVRIEDIQSELLSTETDLMVLRSFVKNSKKK